MNSLSDGCSGYTRGSFRRHLFAKSCMDHSKRQSCFNKWVVNYPFYANIHREGVVLYGAASAVENAVEVQVAIISKH